MEQRVALSLQVTSGLLLCSLCVRWQGQRVSFNSGARVLRDVMKRTRPLLSVAISVVLLVCSYEVPAQAPSNDYLFNDSHFHLTNYIQEGLDIHDFLKIMGTKAGRVALFGIPLQQQWSWRVDEDRGPTYYLNSDAPLYYYSFTDAWI